MGLFISDIVRILQVSKEIRVENKSICMMGKQDLVMDWNTCEWLLSKYDFHYNRDIFDQIKGKEPIDSYKFFEMLGFSEVHALDISPFEGADIVCNLMEELPDELLQKFDYVLDCGTLEHVFDPALALKNMSNLVKTNGMIVHILPLAGWINHGFYSFSPTLFLDFYHANKFAVKEIDIEFVFKDSTYKNGQVKAISQDCRLFRIPDEINTYVREMMQVPTIKNLLLWCSAQKKENGLANIYPIQGVYDKIHAHADVVESGWNQAVIRFLQKNRDKNIVLYGKGHDCDIILNDLYRCGMEDCIKYILDSKPEKSGGTYRGYKIYYPSRLKLDNIDIIIIANISSANEIYSFLSDIGTDIAQKSYKISQIIENNGIEF